MVFFDNDNNNDIQQQQQHNDRSIDNNNNEQEQPIDRCSVDRSMTRRTSTIDCQTIDST
jgi:hypothetical protein